MFKLNTERKIIIGLVLLLIFFIFLTVKIANKAGWYHEIINEMVEEESKERDCYHRHLLTSTEGRDLVKKCSFNIIRNEVG